MIRAFHRTSPENAAAILDDGFRDGAGGYMTDAVHSGVWVTRDQPWSLATGGIASGDALLIVEIPEQLFHRFEWVEEDKGYREALIPAHELNRFPRWRAIECAECGRVERRGASGWVRDEWVNRITHARQGCDICPDCAARSRH